MTPNSSSSSEPSSPPQASTRAPTRSAGTCNITITWRCHERPSTGSCVAPRPSPPHRTRRPRSSYVRFEAEQPNETWQSDVTHWHLADASSVEIITWLDDHSRCALSVTAHRVVTGPTVVATFRAATEQHGIPFSTLTDNGLVFTTRFAHGGRTSRNAFESELVRLRVRQKNSRPNHPTTCGKVERFQQTMKRWLAAQPATGTLDELQTQLDTFVDIYNQHRPHRSLPHRATPAAAYTTRPKIGPDPAQRDNEFRVRRDRVNTGRITIRIDGHLHHIGLDRTLDGTRVIALIHGYDIRIIHAATGEILRALTINPHQRYHGTGAPPGPKKKQRPEPQ